MKDLVNDTIWCTKPDGGEVKVSMGGYTPEQVETLKQTMEDNGWVVTSAETTIKKAWSFPKWVVPYLIGIVAGVYVGWQIWG